MAVYPSGHGQEACQVAAALCLSDGDWMFPTYRDAVAVMTRGVDPVQVMTVFRGDWHSGFNPLQHKVGIQCTPLTKYAISVPLAHQSVAPSLAHEAVGYGMAGERVDAGPQRQYGLAA